MAAFAYTAINAQGLESRGEVHAPDTSGAREQLRLRGLLAQSLFELPASGEESVRTVFKKIKPKSLQIFSRQFAFQIEKETQIKRRVKGAMIYPTMVLIFATLVLIGMLLFLVPVFVRIFAELGGQLPKLTQIVVGVSNVMRGNWYIIFPLAIG